MRCVRTWLALLRGDVYGIDLNTAVGHEQRGKRYVVVVQSDELLTSTLLVCPTSTSARRTSYRPEVEVEGAPTMVLCEHLQAVDMTRLERQVGHVTCTEMNEIDEALSTVLDLAP